MKKIDTYDQYSELLKVFKKDRAHCSTNKLMTKEELTALIKGGKLYYDEIDNVLWFFVNEGYFYTANFYVPAGISIQMRRQDMDVVVELFGNQKRYNERWERELITAGYAKGDKRLEFSCCLDDVIDDVRKQSLAMRAFWDERGFIYRNAKKADYSEIQKLCEEKLGKHRHVVTDKTDAELEDMEHYGRCIVIYDPQGELTGTCMYIKKNMTAYAIHTATAYPGSGLGAYVWCLQLLRAYQENCSKVIAWVRVDNQESLKMVRHTMKLTGKYYYQFNFKSE